MTRLRSQTTAAPAGTASTAGTFNSYGYAYMDRHVEKKSYSGSAIIGWTLDKDTKYLYDAWNLIAELSPTPTPPYSLAPIRTFTWGLDLSQTTQGAGGVGGLISVTKHEAPSTKHTYYATYDANGNVSEYLDANGASVAHYEYSPFGRATVATGTKAADFAHRFSTKYLDVFDPEGSGEHGLYYYGMRSYSPELGRWVNRDPIGERGGWNLNGFCINSPISSIDVKGEIPWWGLAASDVLLSCVASHMLSSLQALVTDKLSSYVFDLHIIQASCMADGCPGSGQISEVDIGLTSSDTPDTSDFLACLATLGTLPPSFDVKIAKTQITYKCNKEKQGIDWWLYLDLEFSDEEGEGHKKNQLVYYDGGETSYAAYLNCGCCDTE